MDYIQFLKLLPIGILLFVAIDFLWIGIVMSDFYKAELKTIGKIKDGKFEVNIPSALVVYVLAVIGILLFVFPLSQTPMQALLYGAIFGLITYGVYDFTNLATLQTYTLRLALVDMAWGGVVCGVVSFLTKYASKFL